MFNLKPIALVSGTVTCAVGFFLFIPSLRGAPNGFTVPVREVRLSAGAGFIVVVTGQIMTMPGPVSYTHLTLPTTRLV